MFSSQQTMTAVYHNIRVCCKQDLTISFWYVERDLGINVDCVIDEFAKFNRRLVLQIFDTENSLHKRCSFTNLSI